MTSITKQHISKVAEWLQPILAISAGFLIALNIGTFWVIVGMWLFLAKDTAMIVFGSINKYKGLIVSSLGSGALNVFGIIRWTFY